MADLPSGTHDPRCKGNKDGDPAGALEADFLRRDALRLRREEEKTYEQIAEALGCSKSTAYKYVNDGWGALKTENDEERLILRAIEEEKLDRLEEVVFAIATAKNLRVEKVVTGKDGPQIITEEDAELQFKAVDRCLKIGKRRAELRGLNAPKEIKLEGGRQKLESLDELAARIALLDAEERQKRQGGGQSAED